MNNHVVSREKLKLPSDPKFLSPPLVQAPLYQCAAAVTVAGFVAGAAIEVEIDATILPMVIAGSPIPNGITIALPNPLQAGQKVRARQSKGSAQSNWSPAITVGDHTKDFPAGPPRPQIDPPPVYECGVRTGVSNLLIGGKVWITENGTQNGEVDGCSQHQGVNQVLAYGLNRHVRAWFSLCNDPSPPSQEFVTTVPPLPLPTPAIDPQYAGGDQLIVRNIVNGAKVTIIRGNNAVGTWPCWGGSLSIGGWNPKFADGETFHAFQAMCPGDPPSPTGSGTVQPCSALPAPQIGPLQGGDNRITLTQFVPGAVITVYLNGVEVGKGGGPVVLLTKTVASGDTVVVIQDLAGCQGQNALQATAACVDPPVGGDPSALDLFPVGQTEFAQGAVKGSIYYPAADDGKDKPFNKRLAALGRVPIVFMAHGNHDPGVPSYQGYDYFQHDLAKMGIVAVSLDCNALNGPIFGAMNIEQRADLIISAIQFFQMQDANAGARFFQRLDFSRVGLMGHSRGAEAVVVVPEVIALPGVTLKSVLSLAPTDNGVVSRPPQGYALLALLPAGDGDVWSNDGAKFYDRAIPSPFKSQLYVRFTNHEFYNRQWLDDDSLWSNAAPTPAVMPRHDHERVLTAYGCALFRATLLGHATAGYLSGDVLPANVQAQNVQRSFERANVLIVDNFQDNNTIVFNSLNRPNTQNPPGFADEFPFHRGAGAFNQSFYGDSIGMIARAGKPGRTFTSALDQKSNLAKREIWVRAAEVTDGTTISGAATGFQLGLQDANGVTSWVDSDAVGGLPRPYPRAPGSVKTMLQTFRFNAACFAANSTLDLTAVVAILLRCNRQDEHAFAFDDLHVVG